MIWAWSWLQEIAQASSLRVPLLRDTTTMWEIPNMDIGRIVADQAFGPFMVSMLLCLVCSTCWHTLLDGAITTPIVAATMVRGEATMAHQQVARLTTVRTAATTARIQVPTGVGKALLSPTELVQEPNVLLPPQAAAFVLEEAHSENDHLEKT